MAATGNEAVKLSQLKTLYDDIQTDITEVETTLKNYADTEISTHEYTLPIASADTLGGIKVGANLSISEDGTLTCSAGGSYVAGTGINIDTATDTISLKEASETEIGGVIFATDTDFADYMGLS